MKVSEFPTSVRATVLRSSNDVKMMESPSTAAIVTSAKEARQCLSVCLRGVWTGSIFLDPGL